MSAGNPITEGFPVSIDSVLAPGTDVEDMQESIRQMQESIQELQKDPGVISSYLESLPAKALSLGIRVVLVVIIFFIGSRLIRLLRRLLQRALEKSGVSRDGIRFLDLIVKWTLYVVLVLGLSVNLGIDASSIVAIIGSLGITIGLALQGSLSNFAGGVLLLLMKPFAAGDYIKDLTTGMTGTVEEVSIFYTKVLTDNRFELMIPNGNLSNNSIINYSRNNLRQVIQDFQISYSSDIDKAREILLDLIHEEETLAKDAPREPEVIVKSLDDSGVTLVLRAFISTLTYLDYNKAVWRLVENTKKRFDEEGIEIPFKQVDVSIRNDDRSDR
ncbi:MAG: mechanosensitive ion channel family protein [Lachnospiraceae bacterium]|nr:mechanosensitive ion channel family protein [Lachnospiraceae bacterium]